MSPASLFLARSAERSAEFVEATTGFEPVNRGFADSRLTTDDHPWCGSGTHDNA